MATLPAVHTVLRGSDGNKMLDVLCRRLSVSPPNKESLLRAENEAIFLFLWNRVRGTCAKNIQKQNFLFTTVPLTFCCKLQVSCLVVRPVVFRWQKRSSSQRRPVLYVWSLRESTGMSGRFKFETTTQLKNESGCKSACFNENATNCVCFFCRELCRCVCWW